MDPLWLLNSLGDKKRRFSLEALKSSTNLQALAAKATFKPEKNRSWLGHPCTAVKIVDGYDRWNQQDVDFLVYFAEDMGLYPIAWEMFNKQGKKILSFWVKDFKTVKLTDSGGSFRYPVSAIFRNSATLEGLSFAPGVSPEETFVKGVDEMPLFPNIRINELSPDDFSLDPSMANRIIDLDSDTLIEAPK